MKKWNYDDDKTPEEFLALIYEFHERILHRINCSTIHKKVLSKVDVMDKLNNWTIKDSLEVMLYLLYQPNKDDLESFIVDYIRYISL